MARTVVELQKYFLSLPRYAVVGASKDESKFGTKVSDQILFSLGETIYVYIAGFALVSST